MATESENNKRIAKNTLYLYLRMFITMFVGLYTSRVVLKILGVSDYGVYNVMGGIIGMLTYVNTLLSGATSRFLTMDLGRGDKKSLKQTFSMANTLSLAAAVIIFILGETVGLWFMNTKLNIDPMRMDAANWVYQCALASCSLSVIQTPYTASIIAHEKMGVYAYMSIFDVAMKLLIVFVLSLFDFDKLKLYALLMFSVNCLNFIIYRIICTRKFEECRFCLDFDKAKFKEMMGYSGWNMVGALANLLNNYGLNILLNIFFGTVVNAARGIALQISHILQSFYSNFQIASRPQIFKYYAQGDVNGMSNLICNTSKYCAFLLMCFVVPILFNVDDFLIVWLGQNPEYTAWFTRMILLQIMFQAIDLPVGMGIHAVGKMMLPNITSAFFYLSVFPLSYMAFKFGASPVAGYCVYLMSAPFIILIDLLILRKYTGFSIRHFVSSVILPIVFILVLSSLISFSATRYIVLGGFTGFAIKSLVSLLATCLSVYYLGLPKSMRTTVLNKIKTKIPFLK